MRTHLNRSFKLNAKRGFTAIELIAVSTIIAVLSMTLVMTVTKHVEKARESACLAELTEFAKFMSFANAETGHYFPLQAYDNTSNVDGESLKLPPLGVPNMWYIRSFKNNTPTSVMVPTLSNNERLQLAKTWSGPYTSFKNYRTLDELEADYGAMGLGIFNGSGPIARQGGDGDEKYPLDPWGNPYIFELRELGQGGFICSTGADGVPGSNVNPSDSDYYTEDYPSPGDLGTGDDQMVAF